MWKNSKFKAYLIAAFGIAWIMQIMAGILALKGYKSLYTIILALSMYAPFAAVVISKNSLKETGFAFTVKGQIKNILLAWVGPGVLAVIGAVIYFLLFPGTFDSGLGYLSAQAGMDIAEVLKAQGMTVPMFMAITVITSFTWGPFLNTFAAIGEEVGWRGYMYKELKAEYGRTKGRIIGGIIWGIWHWPIMYFGYEYGTGYFGYPFLGPLVFCIMATAFGFVIDELYERSGMIWVPALAHGALNAGTWALYFLKPEYANNMILGPVPVGLIAGLPYIITAVLLAGKK